MDTLIFIDTNIFLDFYRVRGDTRIPLLNHIDSNRNIIITTSQVEMEYKKNRQNVIQGSFKGLKAPDWGSLAPPAFLAESKTAEMISKNMNSITDQQKKLKKRIEKVLHDPSRHDPVYKVLQRLFKDDAKYNLNRLKKERYSIRRKAKKRFILGYPPRKDNDITIGDAINWEWTIECAINSRNNIVIVSRDKDYGIKHGGKLVLNDWLLQEFKERVSRKRRISLTDSLAMAFKLASIGVTTEEEKQERKLITTLKSSAQRIQALNELLKAFISKKETTTTYDAAYYSALDKLLREQE